MNKKVNYNNITGYFLLFRNWFIRNLILFLILPLTALLLIFTFFSGTIDRFLFQNPELFKLYQLQTQLRVLSSDVGLPSHIRSLGYDSVIFLCLLYIVWILTHTVYCYVQLSNQFGSKTLLFLETIFLIAIFIFIVGPELSFGIIVLGYFVIAVQIILICLYWGYSLRQKK